MWRWRCWWWLCCIRQAIEILKPFYLLLPVMIFTNYRHILPVSQHLKVPTCSFSSWPNDAWATHHSNQCSLFTFDKIVLWWVITNCFCFHLFLHIDCIAFHCTLLLLMPQCKGHITPVKATWKELGIANPSAQWIGVSLKTDHRDVTFASIGLPLTDRKTLQEMLGVDLTAISCTYWSENLQISCYIESHSSSVSNIVSCLSPYTF